MKRMILFCITALASLTISAATVRADQIPWGYSSADTQIFNSNNGDQTSSISMKGSSGVASGNSGIIIYNLTTSSSTAEASPDSFSSVPFNLAVTLTDIKGTSSTSTSAKTSDTVNFAGKFSASNVTKSSLLPGETSWTSALTSETVLGADDVGWRKYTVTVTSLTPPGQPGGAPGSIQAVVTITPADGPGGGPGDPGGNDGGGDPSAAPEPTSMALAALGLPLIYFVRRGRRKAS